MTFVIKHFNTWSACLFKENRTDFYEYISKQATAADVFHLMEVHSCLIDVEPEFINPDEAGHRVGPIHIKQLQKLRQILCDTHHVYYQAQMSGLHDLDNSYPDVQYGNVTCVRRELGHYVLGGMVYGKYSQLNTQKSGGTPAGKSGHSVIVKKGSTWYQSLSTHGHWDNNGKIDTPHRREQFTNLMSFGLKHKKQFLNETANEPRLIVGGDLNITSECEVLEGIRASTQFGEGGGVVLNHKYKILDTRTVWYPDTKPHREANFVIVGHDTTVKLFTVDNHAPSDHSLMTTVLS